MSIRRQLPDHARDPADLPGRGIVRLAAWLAPAERRDEWVAEWIGELDHREQVFD